MSQPGPGSREVFFAAAIVGTQVTEWIDHSVAVGFVVEHPAGVTTAYTVEGSNATKDAIAANVNAGIFTYDPPTIPAKSAAENFGVKVKSDKAFRRIRMKMVSSVAGGNSIKITATEG